MEFFVKNIPVQFRRLLKRSFMTYMKVKMGIYDLKKKNKHRTTHKSVIVKSAKFSAEIEGSFCENWRESETCAYYCAEFGNFDANIIRQVRIHLLPRYGLFCFQTKIYANFTRD